MAMVNASIIWDGPERNQLILLADPPLPYDVTILEDDLVLYTAVEDAIAGQIVGVEILDFLSFDRWDELPDDAMFKLGDGEPLPLADLLRKARKELRSKA